MVKCKKNVIITIFEVANWSGRSTVY